MFSLDKSLSWMSNASSAASRPPSHGSGPGWFAIPCLYDFFHHCSMPVYPDAIQDNWQNLRTEQRPLGSGRNRGTKLSSEFGDSTLGFIIYPGKLSQEPSFRIGTIGRLDVRNIHALLDAIDHVMAAMAPTSATSH